jgi:hypothetical protein
MVVGPPQYAPMLCLFVARIVLGPVPYSKRRCRQRFEVDQCKRESPLTYRRPGGIGVISCKDDLYAVMAIWRGVVGSRTTFLA